MTRLKANQYDSPLLLDNFHESVEEARANGMTVLISDEHTLFLDLDSGMGDTLERLEEVEEWFGKAQSVERWRSKDGGSHWHMRIRFYCTFDLATRCGLQMFLGSDTRKEALTLARSHVTKHSHDLIRLFMPANAIIETLAGETWRIE